MSIYQSTQNEAATEAAIVEKVATTGGGYQMYMCYPACGNTETSRIKLVEKTVSTDCETYTTKYPQGSKDSIFDWADRADFTYEFAK